MTYGKPAGGRDGGVYHSRSESGYYGNGHKVRVLLPGDPFTGRVGTVQRIIVDDDHGLVYVVKFCGDRDNFPHHTAYFLRDELTVDA